MTIKMTSNKVKFTEAMEEHVNKKFNKILEGLVGQVSGVTVHYSKNENSTNSHKLSAEVRVKNSTIFAEVFGDKGEEFYGMVDQLAKDINTQINKRKNKHSDKKREASLKREFIEDVES
jgi:ribosomal subunit interface protein